MNECDNRTNLQLIDKCPNTKKHSTKTHSTKTNSTKYMGEK